MCNIFCLFDWGKPRGIKFRLTYNKPSRFGSVVAHTELDGNSGRSWVRLRVIPKTLKIVLSAP